MKTAFTHAEENLIAFSQKCLWGENFKLFYIFATVKEKCHKEFIREFIIFNIYLYI